MHPDELTVGRVGTLWLATRRHGRLGAPSSALLELVWEFSGAGRMNSVQGMKEACAGIAIASRERR